MLKQEDTQPIPDILTKSSNGPDEIVWISEQGDNSRHPYQDQVKYKSLEINGERIWTYFIFTTTRGLETTRIVV